MDVAAQRVWLREGNTDFKDEGLVRNYIRREEAMEKDEREKHAADLGMKMRGQQ